MSVFCFFTFPNRYLSLRAERVISETNCSFTMVPVPRVLSTSCGIALRCACEDAKIIRDRLRAKKVIYESFHRIEEKGPRPQP